MQGTPVAAVSAMQFARALWLVGDGFHFDGDDFARGAGQFKGVTDAQTQQCCAYGGKDGNLVRAAIDFLGVDQCQCLAVFGTLQEKRTVEFIVTTSAGMS